ncbi:MAG: 3-hydroxyacyl-CoA dehydrogenase [Salinibacterium sp.]|nr:3-hydroxyacyl-CoA dehydrogenase [Salinibacterium sp.]
MNSSPPLETPTTVDSIDTIAVIGAGSIGLAWSIVFASAGLRVRLYETDELKRRSALDETAMKLADMANAGLLDEPIATILDRISVCDSLEETLVGAGFVQECVVEDLAVKRALFAELDRLTSTHVVLASSTSTIMASRFAEDLPGRERCLVVHPANPPHFLRVAEIVPASFTSPEAIEISRNLLVRVDIAPILLDREIEGFAFNRLQGALLREAYCLVRDGVISAADIDTLVREGLGRRWSLIGPFTTSELNTRGGLRRHGELMGPVYARLGIERAHENPWTSETIERVARDVEGRLPHDSWEENVRERDRAMMQLSSLLKHFDNPLHDGATTPTDGYVTSTG